MKPILKYLAVIGNAGASMTSSKSNASSRDLNFKKKYPRIYKMDIDLEKTDPFISVPQLEA